MLRPPSSIEIRNLLQDPLGIGEAVVLIDGHDQLALMGRSPEHRNTWVGFHPDDVLGPDSPLLPRDEPHDAFVAVCSCTFLRCGGLLARISERGNVVVWEDFRDSSEARSQQRPIAAGPFVFDTAQYRKAILGLDGPYSDWQPTTRQAAQRFSERVSRTKLESHRLRLASCTHLDDSRIEVMAFLGNAGDADRALLTADLSIEEHETADDLAVRAAEFLESGEVITDDRTRRSRMSGES